MDCDGIHAEMHDTAIVTNDVYDVEVNDLAGSALIFLYRAEWRFYAELHAGPGIADLTSLRRDSQKNSQQVAIEIRKYSCPFGITPAVWYNKTCKKPAFISWRRFRAANPRLYRSCCDFCRQLRSVFRKGRKCHETQEASVGSCRCHGAIDKCLGTDRQLSFNLSAARQRPLHIS